MCRLFLVQVEGNPCLAYAKLVVFPWFGQLQVSRKPDRGGDKCAPFACEMVYNR